MAPPPGKSHPKGAKPPPAGAKSNPKGNGATGASAAKTKPKGKAPARGKAPGRPSGSNTKSGQSAVILDLPDPGEPDNTYRRFPKMIPTATFRRAPEYDEDGELMSLSDHPDFKPDQRVKLQKRDMYWEASPLGSGGFGTVHRWTLCDDLRGTMIDDITGKDIDAKREWERIRFWNDSTKQIPLEIAVHRVLSQPQSSETAADSIGRRFITPYLGCRIRRTFKCLRIYSERAACGDLNHVARTWDPWRSKFRQWNQGDVADKARRGIADEYEFMPMEFVLDLFDCLLEACIYMHENGVVHRDLKPNNILLDANTDTDTDRSSSPMSKWGMTPWICDFGLAVPEHPKRYTNPRGFNNALTHFFGAPEQLVNAPPLVAVDPTAALRTQQPQPLDERTTIYELGITMSHVVHACTKKPPYGKESPVGPWSFVYDDRKQLPRVKGNQDYQILEDWLWPGIHDKGAIPWEKMVDEWVGKESPTLIYILQGCCRFFPQDRYGSFKELQDDIAQARMAHLKPQASGHKAWFSHLKYEVPVRFQLLFPDHGPDSDGGWSEEYGNNTKEDAADDDESMEDVEDEGADVDDSGDVEMSDDDEFKGRQGPRRRRGLLEPPEPTIRVQTQIPGPDTTVGKRPWRPGSGAEEEGEGEGGKNEAGPPPKRQKIKGQK